MLRIHERGRAGGMEVVERNVSELVAPGECLYKRRRRRGCAVNEHAHATRDSGDCFVS